MKVEYFNLDEHRRDIASKFDGSWKEIDNMLTRKIISKMLRIDIDHKYYEIHVDSETLSLFNEMSNFTPLCLDKKDNNAGAFGSMLGKTIFIHHNEHRYISLFNEMDEVARIYLIDRSVIREDRLKKLLNK
ncbi:MAG: hypothetical protein SLAVMIC_00939 [uncultured marine phage]|uniref:Uncharacterized protein n=1 Tax=uncultured marine phage TaxID=707152 RepID=A0A8D9CCE8_9VIRU|nr:MAG: hypothetical protein SLAVMIC_00939 [uncultured marine phage]